MYLLLTMVVWGFNSDVIIVRIEVSVKDVEHKLDSNDLLVNC